MSTSPQYASIPKVGMAVVSAANTLRDGTGTLATVFTAGASGSRIDCIDVQATATTTAGMVRLFVSDGTNHRLFAEVPVTPVTPSGTIPSWSTVLASNTGGLINISALPIVLPTGYSLRAATHNAEFFNVIAFGGDL